LSVQPSAAEPAKKSEPKSKKNKEAPAPFEDDFPDLGPSQGPSLSEALSSKSGAKQKNKNKKNGSAAFTIGDEPITATQTSSSAQGTMIPRLLCNMLKQRSMCPPIDQYRIPIQVLFEKYFLI